MKMKKLGEGSFLVGMLLAVIAGVFVSLFTRYEATVGVLLVLLGLLVGFLNVTQKEIGTFLLAVVALLLVGSAGLDSLTFLQLGEFVGPILVNITMFVAPAALVVALKAIFDLAGKK